jgi:hypothetical protein
MREISRFATQLLVCLNLAFFITFIPLGWEAIVLYLAFMLNPSIAIIVILKLIQKKMEGGDSVNNQSKPIPEAVMEEYDKTRDRLEKEALQHLENQIEGGEKVNEESEIA